MKEKIRKYWPMMVAGLCVIMTMIFAEGCATTAEQQAPPEPAPLNYEGDLNPESFNDWLLIDGTTAILSPFLYSGTIQNPDKDASIERVKIILTFPDSTLLQYEYFQGGEIFAYRLDNEQNRYVRHVYTDELIKACMACHEKELNVQKPPRKGVELMVL